MMMSLFSIISLLLLSLSLSSAFNTSLKRVPLPKTRIKGTPYARFHLRLGPQTFAFDSTGEGFYTGVNGGVLKYTPEKVFVDFAIMKEYSEECRGRVGFLPPLACGRPVDIAFNEKTGDLYIVDVSGLHVVSRDGGTAVRINVTVDGKPFKSIDGLDVDPTTGVIYFTLLRTNFMQGNLYKYDPLTKVGTLLMNDQISISGCAVSSDGSFVLVSQFGKNKIKRYWIKGPKAGSSEDFTNSVSKPEKIKRIGSTGNFWVVADDKSISAFYNPAAVKINSKGEVLQTILLKDEIENNLLTEVNEFNGNLYIGTRASRFVRILEL